MAGKGSRRSSLQTIYKREGGICHYCEDPVFLPPRGGSKMDNHPKRATKDHVIPRYYGGESHPRNYVLACAQCNSNRNHDIMVCECDWCIDLYVAALDSETFIDKMFKDLVRFNKPRVRSYRGVWYVYVYDKKYTFDSWSAAMAFTNSIERNPNA